LIDTSAFELGTVNIYDLSPLFLQFGTTPFEQKQVKAYVKYPSNLLPDGSLDDAAAVPFENLQVLLLGICLLSVCVLGGSRFCCLCHVKNPRFEHDSV